jgi:hypothetical protein
MPYGCRLFLLCLLAFSCGAFAQTNPPFEVPKFVWWRGTTITLVKYRNDGNCINIATNSSVTNNYNFDEQNGWLGGIDRVTFKMDGTSCVKVPTRKIGNPGNTWVQMYFQQGWRGCTVGFNQGSMAEIRFFSDSECRQGQWQSVVNQMDMNMAQLPRDDECWSDRGISGGYIYYRMFCDVVAPNHTTTLPVYIHTNVTTLVPSIVKPADLIPLIQSLMVSNASLFKAFSVLSQSTTNNSSPPSPPPVAGAPNKSPSSGGPAFDVGLMAFTLVPAVFFFLLA